jgi:DNA-binding transcriptional regulator YdaS (Cro superfamily)
MKKLIAFLDRQPTGYKARLARALGRPPSYFSRQLSGDRGFTERDCIGIEKYTDGEVCCEDILPGVDWGFLRSGGRRRRSRRAEARP